MTEPNSGMRKRDMFAIALLILTVIATAREGGPIDIIIGCSVNMALYYTIFAIWDRTRKSAS